MSSVGRKRVKELVALWMIGEGIVGSLRPRQYLQLWCVGPKVHRRVIDKFIQYPTATRFLSAAEAGVGVWWALRQITE